MSIFKFSKGAVPLLVLCLQEPDMCLKQISASALSDISKHTIELAQAVIDSGVISILAKAFLNPDAKLKVSFLLKPEIKSYSSKKGILLLFFYIYNGTPLL